MSQPIISVRGVSKRYLLGETIRHDTLRDRLADGFKRILSPSAKAKDAPAKDANEFWALNDVSFDVQQGDVVGIIGRNGAGKSTLLKILSQITEPTRGEIRVRGRIASLLEVGTGFHPELTGRENVYLNGAILGMSQAEIKKKFDEIVAFAEIEKFLDTPVKRYSSGMYVRLAFAVAAHLEPEILIVDEVLAVGDMQFQKKCLGRMSEVSKEGRTVLFVSHNLQVMSLLCTAAVHLRAGELANLGEAKAVIDGYLNGPESNSNEGTWEGEEGNHLLKLIKVKIYPYAEESTFKTSVPLAIEFTFINKVPLENLICAVEIYSNSGNKLAYSSVHDSNNNTKELEKEGPHSVKLIIPENTLAAGTYEVRIDLGIHNKMRIIEQQGALKFSLENIDGLGQKYYSSKAHDLFRLPWRWEIGKPQ